ncbi:MAG: hypothetical protein RIS25_196 [Actinomycetota bacterium]
MRGVRDSDRGGGTVLAIAMVVAATLTLGLVGYFLSTVRASREVIAIAEDAALAASQYSLDVGADGACRHAQSLVESNGARMVSCARTVSEYRVLIEFEGRSAHAFAGPKKPLG